MSLSTGSAPWALVNALERAAWGPVLAGVWKVATSALAVLARAADGRTGRVVMTVPQLADRAHYSTRHTARGLAVLEQLGLVEWERGGFTAGDPTPSTFRVVKARLYELLTAARAEMTAILHRRRLEREARQQAANLRHTLKSGRKTRHGSAKPLVGTGGHGVHPPLPTGVHGPPPGRCDTDREEIPADVMPAGGWAATIRGLIRPTRTTGAERRGR